MILAGDIGGTKTNLGLYEIENGALLPHHLQSFPSRHYTGLEIIVQEFLSTAKGPLAAACFGVAGPVIEGRSVTPNLPCVVDAHQLAQMLNLKSVALINDLEATGYGVAELQSEEMVCLNEGEKTQGNAALVAAGTGLGIAGMFWDGNRHLPSASEGGHMDFAPRNQLEIELLQYLLAQYGRVSVERVVSGPGLFNIYRFLRSAGYAVESAAIAERLAHEDPSAVIAGAALAGQCELCIKALDMFTEIYGATTGNVALLLKATGGVYVGGGIAPKIIEKLKGGAFIKAFAQKGRLSPLIAAIPVRVILNDKTALRGAARFAASEV